MSEVVHEVSPVVFEGRVYAWIGYEIEAWAGGTFLNFLVRFLVWLLMELY